MEEKFAIPGAGGIIIRMIGGEEYLLIQDRVKPGAAAERGLVEIPAGKIREYENIYDCLRREILEETGYTVESIEGEDRAVIVEENGYRVLTYEPFASAQNIRGYYPIMVQSFVCRVREDGGDHSGSDESKNVRWEKTAIIREMLADRSRFYPMHIAALEKYCGLKSSTGGKKGATEP